MLRRRAQATPSSATPLGASRPANATRWSTCRACSWANGTLVDGDRLRTGVTAILPHGGNSTRRRCSAPATRSTATRHGTSSSPSARDDREPAAAHLDALGRPGLEGGLLRAGGQPRGRGRPRHGQRDRRRVLDGWLSDVRAPGRAARARARGDRSGRGRRGRRGRDRSGHRHRLLRCKAGIGGASRRTEAHVVGCLVCSNYGARRDLHMLVGPVDIDEDALSRRRPAGRS